MRPTPIRSCVLVLAAACASSAIAQDVFDNGAVNAIDIPSIDILVQDSVDPLPTTVNLGPNAQVGFALNPDGTIQMVPVLDDMGNPEIDDDGNPVLEPVVIDAPSIVLTGTSSVDMADGSLTADSILASGDSTLTIDGFVGNDLEISGNARVFMNGGRIDDDAFFEGSSRLEVTSGRFDDELQFFDNTTALFTGGEVRDDLVVADNAQVEIQSFSVSDTLEASGSSVTNVLNGSFGAVEAVDGATVNIETGVIEEAIAAATGSVVTIGDMENPAGAFEIFANNSGEVVFTEAVVYSELTATAQTGGVIELDGGFADNLVLNVPGGEIILDFFGASVLDVNAALGGKITIDRGSYDDVNLQALSNSEIEIVGDNFLVNGIPFPTGGVIPFSAGLLEATLANGDAFSAIFSRQFSPIASSATIRLTVIPEPTAGLLVLLGVAGLASRRH